MKIEQKVFDEQKGWKLGMESVMGSDAQVVFIFGSTSILKTGRYLTDLKDIYPGAAFFGCSTSGEIAGTRAFDNTVVSTAVRFESATVREASINLDDTADSEDAGKKLAEMFDAEGLRHLLILSDGLNVNGSDLVKGLSERLPVNVTITGGLSGDGDRFKETLVFTGKVPRRGVVSALGLYGDKLEIGFGSMGGWDPFGPYRLITRSKGNVLYELDGESALELYKKYLGEYAAGLPATGLHFPLSLRSESGEETGVVRTILSVNEKDNSLTFAGDVPMGAYARLMKANYDRLVDGAVGAAEICREALHGEKTQLALLISCVGRKMVLKQRSDEELEEVQNVLGGKAVMTGFYSYGEISPFHPGAKCELHNQTMTITTFLER